MPTDTATLSAICQSCNGTGQYHGTRRDGSSYIGRCFACRPSDSRAERNWTDFAMRYPAEAAWLQSPAAGTFGESLIRGCKRYGGLTMRQMKAVRRNLAPSGTPLPATPPTVPGGQISGAGVEAAQAAVSPLRVTGQTLSPIIGTTPEGVPVTESDVRRGAQVTLSSMVDVIRAERDAIRSGAILAGRPSPITIAADPVRRAMDSAAASGLRKVKLTLGNVTFKLSGRAWIHGQGMILCYHDGSYKGWIDRLDVFHPAPSFAVILRDTTHAAGEREITAFRTAANHEAQSRASILENDNVNPRSLLFRRSR